MVGLGADGDREGVGAGTLAGGGLQLEVVLTVD